MAHPIQTPDVMSLVTEIERQADQSLEQIRTGEATTGASALTKIKYQAEDARRLLERETR